ncbi:Hypothetical protein PP7435_CHR1-1620 [Komagataella phaffii CBS 7435]|uniref:Uncharacterized protein n=1 Tax=Komagataella phaffii (strain ATCC 76273 / CBS 7435 / CECT 11047 / NRRL Y-11430 / Wegner 21-1) TaxID=981350 RepID=A0A1G4KP18_KOMPC|nr:Hypothetical protein BQ9382_C1-0168 [Komagataella phaffii CBS 7435]SCV11754.1 Hypothetical protein PP7435_CHR1-1620 [Komagataella phaffii CBS 7435]
MHVYKLEDKLKKRCSIAIDGCIPSSTQKRAQTGLHLLALTHMPNKSKKPKRNSYCDFSVKKVNRHLADRKP